MSQPGQTTSLRENFFLTLMNRTTGTLRTGLFRTVLFSLALVFLLAFTANAQSTANYTFSTATNASLTDMSSATDIYTTYNYRDDSVSSVKNIGFTYYFMGLPYTQFTVNSNGQMGLGGTAITGTSYSTTPSATIPLLVPLSGDNAIVRPGNIKYLVSGNAPNRTLTVQWYKLRVKFADDTTGTYSTMEVRLYESSGKFEFVYGTMYNMNTSAQSAGVWFSSGNTAGKVGVVENLSTSPAYNSALTTPTTTSWTLSASMTNLNSASDGSRRIFTFTPQATSPADPITFSYTSVLGTSMTVNWVDNSSTETYFVLTRATDASFTQNVVNTTVTSVTTGTTGTTISSSQTGLAFGTTYYYKVIAYNEGTAPSTGLTGSQATTSPSLSGTKTVGPTGDYATLTAAFTAITNNGLSGALTLELQSTYTSASETFPITTPSTTYTGVYVTTVRPQTGVGSTLTVTSSNATTTLDINAGQNWVFDGRPGGSGSNKYLTITNTNATGSAIRFINEARTNTVQYCVLTATANTSTSSGVVFFSTTTGTTGNDNNTITNNDINGFGSAQGVYASGTTTTTAHNNSGVIISNNNIFDVYISNSSTTSTKFISISSGNTDWTIDANKFYMTTSRAYTTSAQTQYVVHINNTSGNNFIVTNNVIGGTNSSNTGTWTTTAGLTTYRIMEFSVGATTPTSVQGNTIKSMSVTTSFATGGSGGWTGMFFSSGAFNAGTTSGNTIGSLSDTGSVYIYGTGATNSWLAVGYNIAATGGVTFSNNNIGSVTVQVATNTVCVNLYAITVSTASTGNVTISGNTVGGTVANSLKNLTGNTTTNFNTRGINMTSTSNGTLQITNNIVRNLYASSNNTGSSMMGIYVGPASSTPTYTISGNTVYNLVTLTTRTSAGSAGALIGIDYANTSGAGNNVISGNQVYGLSQQGGATAVDVYGIYFSNATSTRSTIEKNFVRGITSTSTGTARYMGIYVNSGGMVLRNNMVRLGVDSLTSVTLAHTIYGIWKESGTYAATVVNNSVFLGGTGVVSAAIGTMAFRKSGSVATDTLMNNIFVNNRSNASGTGKHYAVYLNNTTSLVTNYNIFYVSGTGGVMGTNDGGTNDRATILAWQTATTQDANSAFGNPYFLNATGSDAYVDLHLAASNAAEGVGIALTICTDDYDGQTRSGLTPNDIGADAGNFTNIDIFVPVLTYTALGNGTTNNRTVTNFATITDNIGISSGASAPRLYYKRSTDGDVFNDNTSGTDGWKYVSGTGPSPYTFTIDYSLLNGGTGVTLGNTIQYFVVAQDDANNWVSLPTGATASTNPPVQNINGKATTPNTYLIVAGMSGTKTVGTGGDYTTLTAASGLFAAINASALSGNLTVNIISDITTEDGTNTLNQIAEDGVGGYTVTIQSDGTSRTISNGSALAVPMIYINGGDRVTITGGTGNTRNLTFRNTHTTAASAVATIQFNTSAQNNVLQNLVIENNSTSATQGAVVVGSTGTSSLSLFNNFIRDAVGGTTGASNNSFYMSNSTGTVTMQYNKFVNFINSGVNIAASAANCSFVGNSFYYMPTVPGTVTAASSFNGIALTSTNGNHTISGNYIGGQDSLCGGSALGNTNASVVFKAMLLSVSSISPTSVQGNTIDNISASGTFWGMHGSAGAFNVGTVTGNTIGHTSRSASITYTGSGIAYGMQFAATTTLNIQNNLIANIYSTGTGTGVQVYGLNYSGTITNATVISNTVRDLTTQSTKALDVENGSSGANTSAAIIGILTSSTSAGQLISQNTVCNLLVGMSGVTNQVVIGIGDAANSTSTISRNRIYGLENAAAGSPTLPGIAGIRIYNSGFTISNNMISLSNGSQASAVRVYGIVNAASGTNNIYYNSVYLGGSPSSGTSTSGCFANVYSSSNSVLKNNIFYNARVNSGSATGNHYAINIVTVGASFSSNHNLFVTTSSLTAAYKNPTVYTFDTWRTSAGYDFQSFMETTANLSAANLFTDVTTANLNINVNNAESWAVNQRGLPIAGMTDDYGATSVRTATLPGATDIGADEMTPVASQPAAAPSAPPALNTASNYLDNGRTLGTLTFGAGGTAPSAITFTQYRATNPPGSLTGRYANTYWHIANTGGSGFSYDLVLYYDSTMLGTIPFESNIRLSKSEDGGTTWTGYTQLGTFPNGIALDTVNNKLTVYGLTQFSDFTLTDGTNPLPVELSSFNAVVQGRVVTLNWNTATEVNVNRFEVERSLPVEHGERGDWSKVGVVNAAGNSNAPLDYSFTEKLNKTGKYVYRLKMVDNDGKVQYSRSVNTEVAAPKSFALLQNYPNPFNPNTKISFEIPVQTAVKLMVYNSTGELVRVLENGMLEAGVYERNFDAAGLSSGLYLYVLQADGKQFTKKMLLMK